jgi:parallel beta-helix repeat protein
MFARSPLRLLSKKVSNLGPIVLCITAAVLCQAGTVNINPGDDIPTVVANNPPGTTFVIYPGLYRLTTPITAQNGDTFVGQTACAPPTTSCPAILNGAELLTSSQIQYNGTYYYVTDQTQQGKVLITSSDCEPAKGYPTAYPGCIYPEDLYFDGLPEVHVTSLADVGPGSWYFDYTNHIIYFYDNPTGHTVETSVVPAVFAQTAASNVTIEDLTMEEFAVPVLMGAISGGWTGGSSTGQNWVIQNNEIELNHGSGVNVYWGSLVKNNYIHDNGDLGIGGSVNTTSPNSGIVVEGNEIAHNNYAHVSPHFGAGGVDIAYSGGVVFRGNYVHDNEGSGLWMDHGATNALFDGNTIVNNTEQGVFYEISFNGTIRNNILTTNGYIHPNGTFGLWGAGIVSSTSQNVEAYCNTAQISSQGGNGLDIIGNYNPDPGNTSGISQNDYFHHNTVSFQGQSGASGGASGSCCATFWTTNFIDYNSYHVPSLTWKPFAWNGKAYTFAELQSAGEEAHGSVDTNYTDTAPTVAITSPPDQSTVSGTVNVQGNARSGNSISKVEFYVDWLLAQTVSSSPFSFSWNTTGVAAGQHTVAAMAYDKQGVHACYGEWLTVQ